MANVQDVAKFFVELSGSDNEGDLTHLKLQKLLYFAQGHFLAREGKPLFPNEIQAWPLGPVVSSIYDRYKVCGANPITASGEDVIGLFTGEEYEVLLDVAREYGKYSASYLVDETHAPGTPWASTPQGAVIDKELIKQYFQAIDSSVSFDHILESKSFNFIGRRDENGVLVLPVDEDDDCWDTDDEV